MAPKETFLFLMLLFPLLGAVLLFSGAWAQDKTVNTLSGYVASVCMLFSFVCACLLGSGDPEVVFHLGSWIEVMSLNLPLTFRIDPLSALFVKVITGIGFLVHVYSISYMHDEKSKSRYFALINLFCVMMLTLVSATTLPLMFVGWEGVGLCSYFLIGFWFDEEKNATAGKKAFVVNRIGDAGLLLGMFMAFGLFKSLTLTDFTNTTVIAEVFAEHALHVEVMLICFLIGAVGKSAQFPLYIWLPDAMAGPTPVSALIHAATMVTAGVYLLARLHPVLELSTLAKPLMAWVGAYTALFAGLVACVQRDLKKILAFSTVSQLGFMIFALGVGATAAGVFHFVTHAYFKALLFLVAGSVIHALHGEQDIAKMGGLRTYLIPTTLTFIFGFLAIMGFPFFSGWYSKDEILLQAFVKGPKILFWVMVFSALLTSYYMSRLFACVFLGRPRATAKTLDHIHEGNAWMLIPLWVLAGFSLFGGWSFISPYSSLQSFFHVSHADHGTLHAWIAWGLSAACIGVAYLSLQKWQNPKFLELDAFKTTLFEQFYWDETMVRLGRKSTGALSRLTGWMDKHMVDGSLMNLARGCVKLGRGVMKIQMGQVKIYAVLFMLMTFILLIVMQWKGASL